MSQSLLTEHQKLFHELRTITNVVGEVLWLDNQPLTEETKQKLTQAFAWADKLINDLLADQQ